MFAAVVLVALFSLISTVNDQGKASDQLLCIKKIDAKFDEAIIELLLQPPEQRSKESLEQFDLPHILEELKHLDTICPGP